MLIIFKYFCHIQARERLASWGLQLDPRMVNWDGRRLPIEKVFFGKTHTLAGEEADWSRDAVKTQLISTVSCNLCCNLHASQKSMGESNTDSIKKPVRFF